MNREQVEEKLAELDDEDKIQEYLEEAWQEARNEAISIDQARLHYQLSDEKDLDEVLNILNTDVKDFEENESEHK